MIYIPEIMILRQCAASGSEKQRWADAIVKETDAHATAQKIEDMCDFLFSGMEQVLKVFRGSGFFLEYAQELQNRIENEAYRKRGAWAE